MNKPAFASPSARVDVSAYPSLAGLLEASCRRFGDKTAFTSMGVTISFRHFEQLTAAFAGYLQQVLRLDKGDRVAVMLPNTLQSPVAILGALRAGMTVVNISPLYTASELAFQLADSGASTIVVLESFMHTLLKTLPQTPIRNVIVTQVGDLFPHPRKELVNFAARRLGRKVPAWDLPSAKRFEEALEQGALHPPADAALRGQDLAFLQYTGGTTGRPKGAMLTHANMVANVEQTTGWIGSRLKEGEETVVTILPLSHAFALTANLLLFLRLGGNNLLIADPRDLAGLVAQLRKHRFTAITGVNTLFRALLDAPGFDAVCAANRGRLKLAVAGGMAMQPEVAERWQAATGVPIVEGYGLTEAAPIVSANPADASGFSGTLGQPLPLTEVAVLDDAGRAVAAGTVGEICVRGPQVMPGYWRAPEESARVFTADGWLRTGDLGRMDERGELRFVDRSKDIVVVSGLKAYPAEIEEVVRRHPGVKEVGAIGVPDPKTGEAVALFVVKCDPGLDADALREHCRTYLATYMQPRYIEFRGELPMSPVGKVLRRALRNEARTR
ncbi:long-chain acyl-CoA synthetase [Variovorax sp. HW608]|uniref:AMP-binding protein n=1 Tax=Variovorax sp. HW608 TaxID=1034889 RepID=UPI00081F75F1|nr:AMP-binding protein [Variovorax sp. HW608]SCK28270.1 long-chain acyl-CoA synthetase [Variovorax sp. HW608]